MLICLPQVLEVLHLIILFSFFTLGVFTLFVCNFTLLQYLYLCYKYYQETLAHHLSGETLNNSSVLVSDATIGIVLRIKLLMVLDLYNSIEENNFQSFVVRVNVFIGHQVMLRLFNNKIRSMTKICQTQYRVKLKFPNLY